MSNDGKLDLHRIRLRRGTSSPDLAMQTTNQERVESKHLTKRVLTNTNLAALLLFLCAFLIFRTSPIHPINDSKYSMLLSQSLIDHRSFRLDHYAIPRLTPILREDYVQNGELYQIEQHDDHLYYFFPPGSSVLSIPFVLIANAFGVSAANSDGTFNLHGEQLIESWIAAFLMAVLSVVFFATARLVLPLSQSVLVALAASLGTQIWSTTSRAMFSETWAVLLLGCALFLIVRSETRNGEAHPVVVATLLTLAYCTYPLYVVHLVAVSLYFFLKRRRDFVLFVAAAAVWLAIFLGYSVFNFQQLLPNYFQASRLNFDGIFGRLLGHLISPSRGLLIFVPTILIVIYLLARFRSSLEQRRLLLIGVGAMSVHLLIISSFTHWWGGHSYGPRLATACIPWLVLLSIFGLRAMRNTADRRSEKRAIAAFAVILIAAAIFIHGRGAIASATTAWNSLPTDVDRHPERLWDWRQPQFLAGLIAPPPPSRYPRVQMDTSVEFTRPEANDYFWYGWSAPEAVGRWSESTEATMVFAVSEAKQLQLKIGMAPFLVPSKLNQQKLIVKLNGQLVADLVLTNDNVSEFSITLPQSAMKLNNVLSFSIPSAASPLEFGVGTDERRLGVRMVNGEFTNPRSDDL